MSAITKNWSRWLTAVFALALVLALMVGGDQPEAGAIDPADTTTVYIADGTNFADALMGATIAALNSSPMLGVAGTNSGDTIPQDTIDELNRLTNNKATKLDTIYVFGGAAAVSDTVVGQLGEWANSVQRIAGDSRWGTYAAISEMLPAKVDDSDLLDGRDDYFHPDNDGSGSGLDADLLDGMDSTDFLGANETAADSDLLDGLDGSDYQRAVVPSGETLVGTWYHDIDKPTTGGDFGVHMPFSNPLAEPPTDYEYVPPGTPPGTVTGCPGAVDDPTADPGFFCMYAQQNFGLDDFIFSAGIANLPDDARRYGASARALNDGNTGDAFGYGVWAVHVPEPPPSP